MARGVRIIEGLLYHSLHGQMLHCKKHGVSGHPRPGEQYFTVSMVAHTVTMETVKYCSPGVFSYTAFLQCSLIPRPPSPPIQDVSMAIRLVRCQVRGIRIHISTVQLAMYDNIAHV